MTIKNILFVDIETVGQHAHYQDLETRMRNLWDKKAAQINTEELSEEALYNRASIYAEFGKIVCISAAYISKKELRCKSFYGENEKVLLNDFAQLLNKHFNGSQHRLCAHNGKEFDFPYLCRRMLVNGIKIPDILNTMGKKPWETTFIDTLDLWKFGDYKHYTSLDLLAAIFDIESPKNDIDGSMVHQVYWQEKNLEKIKTYCQKDVLTIVKLLHKYLSIDFDYEIVEV